MNTTYNIDYFIKKFEAIPEEQIGQFMLTNQCALWHCGVKKDMLLLTEEAKALSKLLKAVTPNHITRAHEIVYYVNDGNLLNYQQPTPKQRILAALYDIKKSQEEKVKVVYVTIDKSVRELQEKELSLN